MFWGRTIFDLDLSGKLAGLSTIIAYRFWSPILTSRRMKDREKISSTFSWRAWVSMGMMSLCQRQQNLLLSSVARHALRATRFTAMLGGRMSLLPVSQQCGPAKGLPSCSARKMLEWTLRRIMCALFLTACRDYFFSLTRLEAGQIDVHVQHLV